MFVSFGETGQRPMPPLVAHFLQRVPPLDFPLIGMPQYKLPVSSFCFSSGIQDCRIELKRIAVTCKVVEDSVRKMIMSQTRLPESSRRHR